MSEYEQKLIEQLTELNKNLTANFADPDSKMQFSLVDSINYLKRAVNNLATNVNKLDTIINKIPEKS